MMVARRRESWELGDFVDLTSQASNSESSSIEVVQSTDQKMGENSFSFNQERKEDFNPEESHESEESEEQKVPREETKQEEAKKSVFSNNYKI